MKTTGIIPILFILVCFVNMPAVQAQKKQTENNGPKVDIKVQRERDESGNTTRIDSAYTWSWSGSGDLDSITSAFSDQFNMDFDFPMNFTFDFQVPEINTENFNFNFCDSIITNDKLENIVEDFKLHMHRFQGMDIHIDPFDSWGGEEAFREHFRNNFNHEELEKRIEGFFDSEEFQRKMEQLMEKHQELMEKYHNQDNNTEEEKIHKNRQKYHEKNGTKAI